MKNYLTSGLATWTAIPGCSTGYGRKFTGLKPASLRSESETNLGNLVEPCLKIKRKAGPGIQFSSWALASHAHGPGFHLQNCQNRTGRLRKMES